MEFGFEAVVKLMMEHKEGMTNSRHISTDFFLNVVGPLDTKEYLDEDGLPTVRGSEALSNVLVQGLIGNIHMAHENGWRDSAEHLRWIISELEKGFVAVATVTKGTYE